MIPLESLRELYDYNYWARDRQLGPCRGLTTEQFQRPLGSSFTSLRDSLAHLLGAEWVWLNGWQGRSPKGIPADEFSTVAALEESWRQAERNLRSYLEALSDAALAAPFTFVSRRALPGQTVTFTLGKTLMHLLNHQTYHRGQVTTLLRQLGATPVPVDYLVYLDSRPLLRTEEGRMIPLETLRELYDYNYWARDRQLEACRPLTAEQFLRPLGSSFASLRDTLAHLVLVEWVWLERWQGRSPKGIPTDEFSTVAAVEERWRQVEHDLRRHLDSLSDAALAAPLTYVNLRGQTCTYPLGKAIWHLVNHQTYHRGQVTTLLRQLGATPVGVDYTLYLDSRK